MERPIVKYDNQFWVLGSVIGGIAVIWRNGERKTVKASELEELKQ